nr:hypothetical protein [Acidimicrobiia bacterium]
VHDTAERIAALRPAAGDVVEAGRITGELELAEGDPAIDVTLAPEAT